MKLSKPMKAAYIVLNMIENAKDLRKLRLTPAEYHTACGFMPILHDNGKAYVLSKGVANFFDTCGFTVIPPHDNEVCYTVIDEGR